jgi:C-terminal peptidase prc
MILTNNKGVFRNVGRPCFISGASILPVLFWVFAGGMFISHAMAAVDPDNGAADRLWQSFIEKYNGFSLHPLDAETLDAKARAVLLDTAGPRFRSWKPESQATFPALLAAMLEKDATVPKFERVEKTLTALVPKIDTYGHYRSAAAVARWNAAVGQNTGKVLMTLYLSKDGDVRCDPQPDGPAELAGVNPGARLLAVNQHAVEGNDTEALSLAFLGPPDTPVVIKIKQPQGKTEELTLIRTDKILPVVTTRKTALGVTVRIRKFDQGTALAMKEQLDAYPKIGRLTLDLRGNSGGLRDEALKTASLFFPEGTPLGQFTTREGAQVANDTNDVLVDPASIQILQDERTASAAEYLIASLKEGMPDKVSLFGRKTYGKSHSTARVILEGGGELAVTETLLSTASGRSWDKTGIEPDQTDKQ